MGRRARDIAIQALALALIVAAIVYLADNAIANMARRAIASGFAFLSNPAGLSESGRRRFLQRSGQTEPD